MLWCGCCGGVMRGYCVGGGGWLNRMTQFKEKAGKDKENLNWLLD